MNGDTTSGCVTALVAAFVVAFVVWLGVYGLKSYDSRIQIGEAVARFESIAGTGNVEVVRHSNNSWVFGDSHDVTFELLVDGKPQSGRCTSAAFSAMVCRLYGAGGE